MRDDPNLRCSRTKRRPHALLFNANTDLPYPAKPLGAVLQVTRKSLQALLATEQTGNLRGWLMAAQNLFFPIQPRKCDAIKG